ncbi:MAG: hypothetical protein ABIT76_08430 [Chthoniobacterales bacterium]
MNLPKISPFLLGVLLLTSCHVFRSSELQVAVSHTRSEGSNRLENVHRLLTQRGIEHKRILFRYEVSERPIVAPTSTSTFALGETPMAFLPKRSVTRERSGILYRDDEHRGYAWWYVDGETPRQVWLPNDTMERQISFAMRRRIELLRVEEFDRAVDGMAKEAAKARHVAAANSVIDWNARFRRAHGTDFDAASPVDLAKMRALKGL